MVGSLKSYDLILLHGMGVMKAAEPKFDGVFNVVQKLACAFSVLRFILVRLHGPVMNQLLYILFFLKNTHQQLWICFWFVLLWGLEP